MIEFDYILDIYLLQTCFVDIKSATIINYLIAVVMFDVQLTARTYISTGIKNVG